MIQISAPFTEDKIRALTVGDEVELTGLVFTARDAAHKYLHEGGKLPPGLSLQNGIVYHCGPVVLTGPDGKRKVVAAGPTTSIREEPFQAHIIQEFGLRGIIGKGGMGERTLAACKEFGCVYFHAIGGAAQVLAECITEVRNVYFEKEFGSPEAIWELAVVRFPVVVTMDSKGNSLHQKVLASSTAELAKRL